MGGKETNYMRH